MQTFPHCTVWITAKSLRSPSMVIHHILVSTITTVEDIVEAHCYFVDIGRTDREQIHSRINNNDCRTFRPRRPLSTAYRTALYAECLWWRFGIGNSNCIT